MNDSWQNGLYDEWHDWNKTGKFLQKSMQFNRALSYFEINRDWNRNYMNDIEIEIVSCQNIASVLNDLCRFDEAIFYYSELLENEYVAKDINKKYRTLLCMRNVYQRKASKMENKKLNETDSESLELIEGKIIELGLKFNNVFCDCNDRAVMYQDFKNFDDALVMYKLIEWRQDKNDLKATLENYMEIGFCCLNLGKYYEALTNFHNARKLSYAINVDESRFWICFNLYQCYRKLNLVQLALCFLINCGEIASKRCDYIAECLVNEERSLFFLSEGLNYEAYKYANIHYIISERTKNKFEMERAHHIINRIEKIIENEELAHTGTCISVAEALNIANTINSAMQAYEAGNYDRALSKLAIAHIILSAHTDLQWLSIVFDGFGTVLYSKAEQMRRNNLVEIDSQLLLSMYRSAVIYFGKCLTLPEYIKRPKYVLQKMAEIYFFLKDYDTAINCYQLLSLVALENDDSLMVCESLKNVGLSFMKMGNYCRAIEAFTETSEIAIALNLNDQNLNAQLIRLCNTIHLILGA